jgi:hypothetical protein
MVKIQISINIAKINNKINIFETLIAMDKIKQMKKILETQ